MKNFFKTNVNHHQKTIEDYFFYIGILFAVIGSTVMLFFRYSSYRIHLPPCIFHLMTGYYCPGCGGTRALRALLNGRLLQSAWYHPFIPYAAAVYLYFMATQTIEHASRGRLRIGMRYHNGIVWTATALIIGNFVIKNLLHYRYGLVL